LRNIAAIIAKNTLVLDSLALLLPDYLRFCQILVNGGELDEVRIPQPSAE
jgi:hypothetical protein